MGRTQELLHLFLHNPLYYPRGGILLLVELYLSPL